MFNKSYPCWFKPHVLIIRLLSCDSLVVHFLHFLLESSMFAEIPLDKPRYDGFLKFGVPVYHPFVDGFFLTKTIHFG